MDKQEFCQKYMYERFWLNLEDVVKEREVVSEMVDFGLLIFREGDKFFLLTELAAKLAESLGMGKIFYETNGRD